VKPFDGAGSSNFDRTSVVTTRTNGGSWITACITTAASIVAGSSRRSRYSGGGRRSSYGSSRRRSSYSSSNNSGNSCLMLSPPPLGSIEVVLKQFRKQRCGSLEYLESRKIDLIYEQIPQNRHRSGPFRFQWAQRNWCNFGFNANFFITNFCGRRHWVFNVTFLGLIIFLGLVASFDLFLDWFLQWSRPSQRRRMIDLRGFLGIHCGDRRLRRLLRN